MSQVCTTKAQVERQLEKWRKTAQIQNLLFKTNPPFHSSHILVPILSRYTY